MSNETNMYHVVCKAKQRIPSQSAHTLYHMGEVSIKVHRIQVTDIEGLLQDAIMKHEMWC